MRPISDKMIRKAVEADIEKLSAIDTVARNDPARLDYIRRRIRENCCYVLTVGDEQIAAYGVLTYHFYDSGMIDMLMVAVDQRRQGFGSELMRRMESECRTDKLFTSTNESNTSMQALLSKLDYQRSGVIHNLDEGDPELVYFKQLR